MSRFNDIIRRLRNTDHVTPVNVRARIVQDLMNKMTRSSYPLTVHDQVLRAGTQGYYCMVRTQKEGGHRINWTRDRRADAVRLEKKLLAPTAWFWKESDSENKRATDDTTPGGLPPSLISTIITLR